MLKLQFIFCWNKSFYIFTDSDFVALQKYWWVEQLDRTIIPTFCFSKDCLFLDLELIAVICELKIMLRIWNKMADSSSRNTKWGDSMSAVQGLSVLAHYVQPHEIYQSQKVF